MTQEDREPARFPRTAPPRGGERLVFVTGPSGAGRSTAVNVLEDLGFEAIDNLPLTLLPRLLEGPPLSRPLALGLDARNRDFSANAMIEALDRPLGGQRPELLYLDCAPDVLVRRFSETRRRHPLAPAETPEEGVIREIDLLGPVRARADILIDTSEMSPHDLRAELQRWFGVQSGGAGHLAVSVQSFSYKRGVPRGVDMILDCRFLQNPYWKEGLRGLTGRDAPVAAYVAGDPRFEGFFTRARDLCAYLLPAYAEEGKAHFAIGLGCTGGQHRSVALAEKLGAALAEEGWQVSIRHRELERQAQAGRQARSG